MNYNIYHNNIEGYIVRTLYYDVSLEISQNGDLIVNNTHGEIIALFAKGEWKKAEGE